MIRAHVVALECCKIIKEIVKAMKDIDLPIIATKAPCSTA